MGKLCNVRVKLAIAISSIESIQKAYEQGYDTGPRFTLIATRQIEEAIMELRNIEGV